MATYTLSGTGSQAITPPGSLAIVITVFPSGLEQGNANPTNWYHLGLFRLGNAHGYLPAQPVDATNMLVPCPAGMTLFDYKLRSGVTITVEERSEILQPLNTLATSQTPPNLNIISPFSWESLGPILAATASANPSTGAYASANAAYLYPFRLSAPFTSTHAWWANGTTTSGNIDIGVYDSAFARLGSIGSTAQGTASAVTNAALALTLQPGLYYLAVAMNNTTGHLINAVAATPKNHVYGCRTMAAAFALPTTITPVSAGGVGNIYLFGLATFQP